MAETPSLLVLQAIRQCVATAGINGNAPDAIQTHRAIADALEWLDELIEGICDTSASG